MYGYVGEIKMFAGNFAPQNTALCSGQILPISQNTALFSILGTYYGGNGVSTFQLPNLMGRVPMAQGTGPGLTPRTIGESAGSETVTLLLTEIPAHTHNGTVVFSNPQLRCYNGAPTSKTAEGNLPANSAKGELYNGAATSSMVTTINVNQGFTSGPSGGGQPHNNMQPYLAITFVICMQGVFPPRG